MAAAPSPSESILRRPKEPSPPRPASLSVTLLSREQLPSYSSERFYLLSELQQHSHSLSYLPDLTDDATAETEELSVEDSSGPATNSDRHRLPSFVLLYLVWTPDLTDNPRVYCETVIDPIIRRLQSVTTLGLSLETSSPLHSPTSDSPLRIDTSDPVDLLDEEEEKELQDNTTSVYIVVDKVNPGQSHAPQVDMAEELAKAVANHPHLRRLCEGITVGVSNHERAAPGLEACVKAIEHGARCRRPFPEARSVIGLVAEQPSSMLGLQSSSVVDAANRVEQTRVCAEWNGRGTIESFARRAHRQWRYAKGLGDEVEAPPVRKIPRRLPKLAPVRPVNAAPPPPLIKEATLELLIDGFVLLFLMGFSWFQFRQELQTMTRVVDPTALEDFVQYLREL